MDLVKDETDLIVDAEPEFVLAVNFEDDFDDSDVVVRHPRRSSRFLLADGGDGSEADLLGTTPPRSRIRSKEIRKNNIDTERFVQKAVRTRRVGENTLKVDTISPDRLKKRASLKLYRSRERDWKQDMSQREHRSDSLPSPVMGLGVTPAVPTLVESCNRFMCLTSRLKSRESSEEEKPSEAEHFERWCQPEEELPASRVNFHKTFSMLINMGNMEKGCRRTISREEQVWQNELKDLIWLELQAKIAGRTLAQQDAYLCAQRNIVPTIVQNVINYRFVNPNPCQFRPNRLSAVDGSREDLSSDYDSKDDSAREDSDENVQVGCLSFNCRKCTDAIGKAMKEIGTLLDSFYNAVALYPSSKAMTVEHPLIATKLFKNRLKAMCLWYNTALHMRLKMLSVRYMMRSLRLKRRARLSDSSRQSSTVETQKPCQVRFNVSDNPSDSNNSDSSNSDSSKDVQAKDNEDEVKWENGHAKENGNKTDEEGAKDEVDNVSPGATFEHTGPPTPEIVISDSRYGTADTSASSESGYTSGPANEPGPDAGVCDLGDLRDLTRLRLLGHCAESPYREYHQEMLKTQGVRRCMMFMSKMRQHVLHKVHVTLEKPHSPQSPEEYHEEETVRVFDDTKDEEDKTEPPRDDELEKTYELKRFGCWSEESLAMRLPSYRHHFLALSVICMEAVHDYLSLRLEARPDRPSCLTVKQLIHELKEGLDISTEMRHDFVRDVEVALEGVAVSADARTDLLLVLRTYDATVESVLKQYLSYLTTMSETEHMSRAWLQAEWSFTARLAKRVKCAALLAPITFSDISCNQITRLLTEFKDKFDSLLQLETTLKYPPNRDTAYMMCRAVQDMYARWREPLLHAAQWARALAARLARARPPGALRAQRDHICDKLMSMREFTMLHTKTVLERTMVPDEELELTEGLLARVRELLLQMFKLGFELHKEMYKLVRQPSKSEDQRRARPASLQPLRQHDKEFGLLRRRRPDTIIVNESINPLIHKELHRVVNEVPGRSQPRRSIVNSPPKVLRPKFVRSESIGEDSVFDDKLFENLNSENHSEGIVRLLAGEDAAPETVQLRGGAGPPPDTGGGPGAGGGPGTGGGPGAGGGAHDDGERRWAALVARAVIEFATCWMRFVVERCDRGRGLRPRWASQGLEFLMLACDPCNTKHLSEEEFEELKQLMDGCISHVVGSRPCADAAPAPRARPRLQSPSPTSPQGQCGAPLTTGGPPSPPQEPDPLLAYRGHDPAAHVSRVCDAVHQLEEERDEKLRELKAVGRVVGSVASYEPKLKQVTFKWQRGLKIGAGTFGKVYTVVNTDSGQLLAMKELAIGVGDRRALQRAANELRVLEGVIHPHLVRYYGCELHREEMLIFMELCVEGSLEALVATSGALAEPAVRRYGQQLVSALLELHARNIVHRDIKSGNIFLTNEGHCLKLGDFGCAVKIRANTTAPGELQGFVGTQAYMAPEVFMKSSGHGRAADIWSLGCVVTEMASGKRPFSEYDSNYQIMFVVGMGGRPAAPRALSPEGHDFCRRCLTHDPATRARAADLAAHSFLMVKSDDDCRCEPAFLM